MDREFLVAAARTSVPSVILGSVEQRAHPHTPNPPGLARRYLTLSVMFLGGIKEADSNFALDSFVDVIWRDDRVGPNSPQAFGCTPPNVGLMLQVESMAPNFCSDFCNASDPTLPNGPWCDGAAVPAPCE